MDGEPIQRSKLTALRPHVDRLRAVRTGPGEAALYIGWPECAGAAVAAPRIYELARAFSQASGRQDRLLENQPVDVQVHVHAAEPELEGESMTVLMDLSGLPLVHLEVQIDGLEVAGETLDWFLDVVVAGAWRIVEG